VAALLGVVYALFPKWFLSKKYQSDQVPDGAVKTARAFGVMVAALGAVLAVTALSQM
jgi:hypothetical protein